MTRIRKVLCVSLFALLIGFPDARAADYDGLITQARILLEGGGVENALTASNEAVKLNPAGFKGHYYVAMALMSLGRFDEAQAAAAQALTLAPESGRAAVEKLRDSVKARKDEAVAEQAASAALAEGLFGKAAPAYERAWLAGRARPDLGLKAADLYTNRLKSPVDAGRVLRQVVAAMSGRPEADLAQTELQKIAPVLRGIAQDHVGAARSSSGDEALRRLAQAEAADPDFADVFIQRARVIADGSNVDAMRSALKDLARLDQATPDVLGNLPDMPRWLERPEIGTYLEDLIGRPQFESVGKVLAAKAEERRAADEAVRLQKWKEEQHRLEEEERLRRIEAEMEAKKAKEVPECQKLVETMARRRESYEEAAAKLAGYKSKLKELNQQIAEMKAEKQRNPNGISFLGLYELERPKAESNVKWESDQYSGFVEGYRENLRTYNKKCLNYVDDLDLPDKF